MSDQQSFVYIVTPEGQDRPCKVGLANDPDRRLSSLQTGSPVRLVVREEYWFGSRKDASAMEREFHDSYAEHRLQGEWFDITFDQANFWLFENTIAIVNGYGEVPN